MDRSNRFITYRIAAARRPLVPSLGRALVQDAWNRTTPS